VEKEREDQFAPPASAGKKQAMPFSMPDQRLPNFLNDTLTLQAAYHPFVNFLGTQSQGLDRPGNTEFT
jgi:hypothetical protein